MNENEAIETLREQFTSDTGFVARLCNGDGLDLAGVELAIAALETLRGKWADREDVPKVGVLPMVDVYTRIYESAHLYRNEEEKIEDLADDLRSRMEEVFLTGSDQMTEQQAMAVVWAQLSSQSSFVLDLHQNQGLRRDAIQEVRDALETLQRAWADRTEVPKSVVGPMIDVRSAVWGNARWYPDLQPELRALAEEFNAKVERCLSSD